MDLRELSCFVAVAEEAHFGKAAERLHHSTSYVSQRVQRLERELGVRLFERTSRTVHLTDAGRQLKVHADEALRAVANLGATAGALARLRRSSLVLAYSPFTADLTTPLVQMLRRDHTEIDVELQFCRTSAEILHSIHRLDADAGLVPWLADDLEQLSLRPQRRFSLLVPTEHPFAGQEAVTAQELDGEPLLIPDRATYRERHDAIVAWFASIGVHPDWRPWLAVSIEQVRDFVVTGKGIAITYPSADIPGGTTYVPLLGGLPPLDHVQLVWDGTRRRSPSLEALITSAHAADLVAAS